MVGRVGVEVRTGTGGLVRSMRQLNEVGALCPPASTAFTAKVWVPSASGPVNVLGLLHALNAAPSRRQRKLTPERASENENVADCTVVGVAWLGGWAGVPWGRGWGGGLVGGPGVWAGAGSAAPPRKKPMTSRTA